MSLINDVLNDLDRKPDSPDTSVLGLIQGRSDQSRSKRRVRPLVSLIVLVLLAGVGFLGYQEFGLGKQLAQFLSDNESETDLPVTTNDEATQTVKPDLAMQSQADAQRGETPQTKVSQVMDSQQADAEFRSQTIQEPQSVQQAQPAAATVTEVLPLAQTENPTDIESPLPKQTERVPTQPIPTQPMKASVQSSEPKLVNASHTESSVSSESKKQTSVKPAPSVVKPEPKVAEAFDSELKSSLTKSKTREVQLYEKALASFQQGDVLRSEALVDELLTDFNQPKYMALKARLLLRKTPKVLVNYLDQQNVDITSSSELLALAASAYQRQGDHLRAVKAYDLLVQRQPEDGRWWLAMAFSLEALEALDKSYRAYSLALQSGTLPASGREFAARKSNQIKKQLEALAKQAEEQK
ncbi:tetratricopeptide repeat protein [Litoribrevibacter euphylliae]|uniref:Tetratricopeptide repeat protein n=1 Tax=Litoribrevibacter euphylliae TaxID=1834034 RepID=A0ABV7HL00_9GAMM